MEQDIEVLSQYELSGAVSHLQIALDGLIRSLPSERSATQRLRATAIAGQIAERVEALIDLGYSSDSPTSMDGRADDVWIGFGETGLSTNGFHAREDLSTDGVWPVVMPLDASPNGKANSSDAVSSCETDDMDQVVKPELEEASNFGLSGRSLDILQILRDVEGKWFSPAEIVGRMSDGTIAARRQAWVVFINKSKRIPDLASLLVSRGQTSAKRWRYGTPMSPEGTSPALESETKIQEVEAEVDDDVPITSEVMHEPEYQELTDWGLAIKRVEDQSPKVVIGRSALFGIDPVGIAILELLADCPSGKAFNALTEAVASVLETNIKKSQVHNAVENILVQFKMRGQSDKLIVEKIKMANGSFQKRHKLVGAIGGAASEDDEIPDFLAQ